jgi:hypothetical protein
MADPEQQPSLASSTEDDAGQAEDLQEGDSGSPDGPASLQVEALPAAQHESAKKDPDASQPVTMEETFTAPSTADPSSLEGLDDHVEHGQAGSATQEPASLAAVDVGETSKHDGSKKHSSDADTAHSIAMEETTSMLSADFALPSDGAKGADAHHGTAAIAEAEGEDGLQSQPSSHDAEQQSLSLSDHLQEQGGEQSSQGQGPPTIATTDIPEESARAHASGETSVAMQETGSIASGLFGSQQEEVSAIHALRAPEPAAADEMSLRSMDSEQAGLAAPPALTDATPIPDTAVSNHEPASSASSFQPTPVVGGQVHNAVASDPHALPESADVSVFRDGEGLGAVAGADYQPDSSIVDVTLSDSTLLSPAMRGHAHGRAHDDSSAGHMLTSTPLAPTQASSAATDVSVVSVAVGAPEDSEIVSRSRSKTLSQGDWGDAGLPAGPLPSEESRPRSKTSSNLAQLAGLAPAGAIPAAGVPSAPPVPQSPAAATAEEEQARQLIPGAVAADTAAAPGSGEDQGKAHDVPSAADDHFVSPPTLTPSGASISELDAGALSRTPSRLAGPRGLGEEPVVNIDLTGQHEGPATPDAASAAHQRIAHMVEPVDEFELFESASPEQRASIEVMHAAWPAMPAVPPRFKKTNTGGAVATEASDPTLDHARVLHVTPADRLAELAQRHGIDPSRRAAVRARVFVCLCACACACVHCVVCLFVLFFWLRPRSCVLSYLYCANRSHGQRHEQDAAGDITTIRACIQRRSWRAVRRIALLLVTHTHTHTHTCMHTNIYIYICICICIYIYISIYIYIYIFALLLF